MVEFADTEARRLDFQYTEAARQDLVEVAYFLDAPSFRASEFTFDLYEAVEHLRRWPFTGHRKQDLTDRDVCFWPFSTYYVVFHVQPDLLTIIAVLHHRRDIARILGKRLTPARKHNL